MRNIRKSMKSGKTVRKATVLTALMGLLAAPFSHALTVVSTPSFTPSTNAPLAGVLSVGTDVDSFVSVSVNDGTSTWQRDFFDFGTKHSETLLGFKLSRTNQITVTVRDQNRNTLTAGQPVSFVTGPLPSFMPNIFLVTNNPAQMEPGYTLFRVANLTTGGACVTILDYSGQVVWFAESSLIGGRVGPVPTPTDVHQLPNGNLFFPETSESGFGESDMLGNAKMPWSAAPNYLIDSHEDLLTDHGTILYLSVGKEVIANFPSSATDPSAPTAPANVSYGRVVEISATNSALLNEWSLINMLDPVRIDYLCFLLPSLFGIDPEHANAIIDSTSDNSIIVSMRNQDSVVKFSRSGQIKWILGPHENWSPEFQPYLLTPVGTPFEWNYGQHAPVLTPQGTLLFFDDGNCRAEPFAPPVPDQDNYSRAAEFSVDEANMEVSQVWEFTGTNFSGGAENDRLYCGLVGNATQLPQTGNVLVTFGDVSYENGARPSAFSANAAMVRLKEVTHDANPTVVFDVEMFDPTNTATNYAGYQVYRSYRIPDLYPHPAAPVVGLTVQDNLGAPLLQFTADPARTYVVQSSADLINWFDIGAPDADDADGDFSFVDDGSDGLSTQFYRILTQ